MGNNLCNYRPREERSEEIVIIKEGGPENDEMEYQVELTTSRAATSRAQNTQDQKVKSKLPKEVEEENAIHEKLPLLQKSIRRLFLIDEKAAFKKEKGASFVNTEPEDNLDRYFTSEVKQVSSKLPDLVKTLPEKYVPLYKRLNHSSFRLRLPALTTTSEEIYRGSWNVLSGKFNGYGILVAKDGAKFEGFWIEGSLHHYGRIIQANGDYYEGEIRYGRYQGKGYFEHFSGGSYRGDWVDDQMHGTGEEIFVDNSHFAGDFRNGKKTGKGKFTWKDGSKYEGEVFENVIEGFGEYFWAEGNYYRGFFKDNLFEGKGFYRYADDKTYDGEFKANKRNGFGKYSWNETKYYEGNWMNGVQHGEGVYVNEANTIKGIWSNGTYLHERSDAPPIRTTS